MNFEVEKNEFLKMITRAQNIVEKRNTMPVLVNILIEAKDNKLKIFATNLEVSLTDSCSAKINVEGRVAIAAKNLYDLTKELSDGTLKFEKQKNNWLRIKQGKSMYNIVGINPDEYPVFPTFETNEFTKVQSSLLKEMIEKTIYSVSNDETRYHLNGVYFENHHEGSLWNFRMVATDGHRLSLINRKFEKPSTSKNQMQNGVIIPRKGLYEIKKLIDQSDFEELEMAIEGAQLFFKTDTTILMIRLIEGKYPNYKQLIPQNLKENISIDKESLLASLKRVSLLSNQKSKGVTLNFSGGKMEITSNNPELGDAKEELDINYSGKDFKIGFNARYILDVLSNIDENEIQFSLKDHLSPGLMRPNNDQNYTCVIMPMKI